MKKSHEEKSWYRAMIENHDEKELIEERFKEKESIERRFKEKKSIKRIKEESWRVESNCWIELLSSASQLDSSS